MNSVSVLAPNCARMRIEGIDVTAGELSVVANARGDRRAVGANAGFDLWVVPRGAVDASPDCKFRLDGIGPAGGRRRYALSSCPTCLRCMKALGYNCAAPTPLDMRVRARPFGRVFAAGAWAVAPFAINCTVPTCRW